MVEVVNAQRKLQLDRQHWKEFGAAALAALGKQGQTVTIAFVSDRRIQQLNRDFRGLNKPTDVLSFRCDDGFAEASLGDIVISAQTAERQARENGLSFEHEIAQLILHGLLHLSGYDHETDTGEMNRTERRLRRRLGI